MGRLLAGVIVGAISGSQSGPVNWSWYWPRIWPLDWRTDSLALLMLVPALLTLAAVAWMQFTDERAIARERGRPRHWCIHAGQAILHTLLLTVGFGLVILFFLVVAGAILVGFVWLTYGSGPVRGAVIGALIVGLWIRAYPQRTTVVGTGREDTDGQENTR